MAKRIFEINTELLFGSDAFIGATKEELRVLVAVMADRAAADEEIAEAAGVSVARCRSALTLFEEEKILISKDTVSEEFEAPILEPDEDCSVKVADDIRDNGLAELLTEFAKLLSKPTLSTGQVKKIVALNTNYSLSEEYLLNLGAYLADLGKLSVARLVSEAIKLVERDIDTPEALQAYIDDKRHSTDADLRIRRLFKKYDRPFTKSESMRFKKWIYDFGYSEEILEQAYELCVAKTDKFQAGYMDHILERWHEKGCKTLSDCNAQTQRDRAELAAKNKNGTKSASHKGEQTAPKYGAFSAEDALMRALERSYGTDDK